MDPLGGEEMDIERYKPATVKDGWTMPDAPKCSVCGEPLTPEAVFDADQVVMMWSEWCENNHDGGLTDPCMDCDWPFVENFVFPSDFQKLGFRYEVV